MSKFTFSFKSLLVACGLLVGSANAWGGITTLLNIDYSTTTTPAWTVVGGSGSIVDGAWKHVQGGGGGNRSAYLDFGVASSIDDNWTVEFDAALKPGSDRNDQQITVSGANTTYTNNTSATGYMYFAVKEEANGGVTYTVKIGNTDVATGVTLSNGTTYHFKVEYDGSSAVTAYIGETKYEGTVAIANVGKLRGLHGCVARYHGAITYDNIVVTKEVNAEEVSNPSIAVAYAGANRTVTITPGVSSESNVVTTYYTLNGEDPTSSSSVYSTPLDVDADCTVKAISISSTSVSSGITSQAVTVGTLKLVAPTFSKTGYAAGKYTVSMASNQSGLAYPPASYTNYYSIDGGDAVAYSAPFELSEGSTVTGYVVATNYTNSDEATLTSAVRPPLVEVWSIDFAGQATEDKGSVTVGDAAFTANGVSFGNISGSFTSNDNFGVKTGTSWLLRNTGSTGLYSFNGSGTPVGVQGLKAGQYIKMVVNMTGLNVSDAASLVDEMSTVTEKYIVVNSDGNANINFDRYGYIKSISVCDVAVPVTISAAGYATFNSDFALDLDNISGATAYIVKADAASGDKIVITPQTGKVAANTGLILKGDAGTVTIPVAASGTDVSATNKLVAVTADATPVAAGNYVLGSALDNSNVGLYKLATEKSLNKGQAYLPGNFAGAGVKMLNFIFEDETVTGVDAPAVAEAEEDGVLYNTAGQIVTKDYKGIVIKNGKKYYQK